MKLATSFFHITQNFLKTPLFSFFHLYILFLVIRFYFHEIVTCAIDVGMYLRLSKGNIFKWSTILTSWTNRIIYLHTIPSKHLHPVGPLGWHYVNIHMSYSRAVVIGLSLFRRYTVKTVTILSIWNLSGFMLTFYD